MNDITPAQGQPNRKNPMGTTTSVSSFASQQTVSAMALDEPRLSIRDLNFFYGSNQALKHINLDFPASKVTGLIGPSGCGEWRRSGHRYYVR